ncbi:MAG: hypothetical protein AVDCRST_MAG60-885 [uncultured Nocardioides sp.]|uniref:Uncharacterized protein n=1 Tax=uncultured Nocardioides sp. TaxID=198441 RepID=A0A6J4NB58_9ACTN|nr:MAG: hypothetical protein AVDCRST_MAG60-885 [uncultured Nocardioides sp.]
MVRPAPTPGAPRGVPWAQVIAAAYIRDSIPVAPGPLEDW